MHPPMAAERLNALRRDIAAIEGTHLQFTGRRVLPLKIPAIDQSLLGGLAFGALHEFGPTKPVHLGAALGFALALACGARQARRNGDVVWIETAFASGESGRVYGCGLQNFGLPLNRVVIVRVPRPVDALWALQEALGCRGIAAVIATLTDAPDLTATRRLALTVRDSGGLGLLVMQRISPQPSAALTRWEVAAARSRPDRFGGFGLTAFDLRLTKNRHGPDGRWTIAWDHHERAFLDPLSVAVAQAAFDRSDHALRSAGRALRRGNRALRRA